MTNYNFRYNFEKWSKIKLFLILKVVWPQAKQISENIHHMHAFKGKYKI